MVGANTVSNLPKQPITVPMHERRVVLGGSLKDGVYRIGFTVADEPLLTPEAIKACPENPVVVLEFKDEHGMKILAEMVASMLEHKRKPTWEVVYTHRKMSDDE